MVGERVRFLFTSCRESQMNMEHFPCISMELHELKSIEFHGILSGIGTWNSMELYGILSGLVGDGVPWKRPLFNFDNW